MRTEQGRGSCDTRLFLPLCGSCAEQALQGRGMSKKQEGRRLSISQSSHTSLPKLAQAAPASLGILLVLFFPSCNPPRSAFPLVRRRTKCCPCWAGWQPAGGAGPGPVPVPGPSPDAVPCSTAPCTAQSCRTAPACPAPAEQRGMFWRGDSAIRAKIHWIHLLVWLPLRLEIRLWEHFEPACLCCLLSRMYCKGHVLCMLWGWKRA